MTALLNVSVIHHSLRYITTNFKAMVGLSTWIDDELTKIMIDSDKLFKIIIIHKDFELSETFRTKCNREKLLSDIFDDKIVPSEDHLYTFALYMLKTSIIGSEFYSFILDIAISKKYKRVIRFIKEHMKREAVTKILYLRRQSKINIKTC